MRLSSMPLALMLLAAMPALAAGIIVELHADAVIGSGTYRVGDVAAVKADDPALAKRLGDMEIGVAPRPGHSERLTQQQVMRFIEAHIPESRGKLHMAGSRTAEVHATATPLDKERVQRLAMAFLQNALGAGYERVEIKPASEMREIRLPQDAEIRLRPLVGSISRRTAIWVDVYVAGRPYTAIPVWFSVHAWKQVPVARRELPAGSELRMEDFELATYDVMLQGAVVDRLPTKSRLRVALGAGAPLVASALEAMPEVRRNQEIAVRVEAGNIVIETAGVAQTDGRLGDMVRVKNAGGGETFLARVLEPGVVAINAR